MTTALETSRKDMVLQPSSRVRVCVEPGSEKLTLILLCLTCESNFVWEEREGWWVCPACGIELTLRETALLLRDTELFLREARRAVEGSTDVGARKKGGLWAWVLSWLRRSRTDR